MGEQHTPGPWKATERSGYHEVLGARNHADWYGTKEIWAVAYCDTDREEDEQIANARLIAAAPELLAALQHILAGSVSLPRFAEAEARAALAKALGK